MVGDWLTTAPNPQRHRTFTNDDGCTGWRTHFVPDDDIKALCGLRAKHGWAIDLAVDTECIRCANAVAKLGGVKIMKPQYTHYSITNCDTHKLFWAGRDVDEAVVEAGFAVPASEFYVTEWFGIGNDDDEIIEQMSVDEWLEMQKTP